MTYPGPLLEGDVLDRLCARFRQDARVIIESGIAEIEHYLRQHPYLYKSKLALSSIEHFHRCQDEDLKYGLLLKKALSDINILGVSRSNGPNDSRAGLPESLRKRLPAMQGAMEALHRLSSKQYEAIQNTAWIR
jgi:hypothetical protein